MHEQHSIHLHVRELEVPLLVMQCFGMMEGARYSDLVAEGKLAGVKSILHYTPPGAETVEEFESRAKAFFCEICKYVDNLIHVFAIGIGRRQILKLANTDCNVL